MGWVNFTNSTISEEMEGPGFHLSSFDSSSCDVVMSITGCWCCTRQSPGTCTLLETVRLRLLPSPLKSGVSYECPEMSKGMVGLWLMQNSLLDRRQGRKRAEWKMKQPFSYSNSEGARVAAGLLPERLPFKITERRGFPWELLLLSCVKHCCLGVDP